MSVVGKTIPVFILIVSALMNAMRILDCLRWLWRAACHHQLSILCYTVAGMVQAGLSLLFVYVCKRLTDIASGESGGNLGLYIGLLAMCMVAQLLLTTARSYQGNRTEIRLRNGLRYRLFSRLMDSCWFSGAAIHTGDMLNRLEEDVPEVTDALCRSIPAVLVTCVQLGGALYFLFRLDTRLAGILAFIMPLALLSGKSYVFQMRRMSREIRDTDSRIQSHLQESLQHRILVRTLEYTGQSIRYLAGKQIELQDRLIRRIRFSLFSRSAVQAGFMAGYALAFLWGVYGLRDGSVTFGMMVAFLQLVSQVQHPLVNLSRQIPVVIRVFTSTERLAELDRLPTEEKGKTVWLEGSIGIRIRALTFAYPGGLPVFSGFTHDFVPGSLTALVGKTGAGKSTLVRLILALFSPDKGEISFYNATQAVKASPRTRCNLSYVPQGNTLMSGSIRDNLLMGNPAATEEELAWALHAAVADFVYDLPDGLESPCGEQGTELSEGQAQRIAIARGLLRPGAILLLDEPTSSLDKETEKQLVERLSSCVKDKTLVLITHREMIARLCTSVVRIGK